MRFARLAAVAATTLALTFAATPAGGSPAASAAPAPSAAPAAPEHDSNPALPTARTSITLAPVTAYGSQAAVDRCKLVLWQRSPFIVAAHNYCGYQWMSSVPTGTKIRISRGPA